jgi:tetratricopeptide (TPR) repeat protein
MQQVEELLTLEPNHRGCLMLKSELLFYMREFDEAILQTQSFTQQETHLNTRIEASCLQKKRAVESQLIAKCYMRLKDWDSAVGYWREGFSGLGHGPEDAKEVRESLHGMVTCYYHQGEYAKAISLSDGAIEMNRHYDGVYDHRALAQET